MYIIFWFLISLPGISHAFNQVSGVFANGQVRSPSEEPYRTIFIRDGGVGEDALRAGECLRDLKCLSFDSSSNDITKLFTGIVCEGGTHCLVTRCPDLESMRYSRAIDMCYRVSTNKTLWTTANSTCAAEGGRLIVLDTEEKFIHIKEEFDFFQHPVWLGASWSGTRWEWVNGQELLVSNPHWHIGEPNNILHEYVSSGRAFFGHFGLDDRKSTHANYFLCEY